jgi:chromosome segregation ATPase
MDESENAAIAAEDAQVYDIIRSKGLLLEGFKREYQELRQALVMCSEDVIDKEREVGSLNAEILHVREQANISMKISEDTVSQREAVQLNIESLQLSRRKLLEKESSNRAQMSLVSSNFSALHAALEVGAGWTPAQDEERKTLEKERSYLFTKYDAKSNQVEGVRMDIDRLYESIRMEEDNVTAIERSLEVVKDSINNQAKLAEEQTRRGADYNARIQELGRAISTAETELGEKTTQLRAEEQALVNLEESVVAVRERMDEYTREFEALARTASAQTFELEKCVAMNRGHENDILEREKYIEDRRKEVAAIDKDFNTISKLLEAARAKIAEVDEEKVVVEQTKEELQKKVDALRDDEAAECRRQSESLSKAINSLSKEIAVVSKKYTGSENATKAINDLIFSNNGALRNLAQEKRLLQQEVTFQQEKIQHLVQEKEKYEHTTELMNQQYYTSLEELKLQELQYRELQKKIAEDQAKLKQKQNMYEAVRSDRNLYSKQLSEYHDEITTLKAKFRMMNHQIEQLKEEISVKDHAVVKEHFYHHAIDKEKEMLKNELTKIRKQLVSSVNIIENQHIEVLKLTRIIEEAEEELQRQGNELAAIMAEKNVLTTQLVKRNSELREMYGKIKIQRSNLRIGEQQYMKLMNRLASLQQELIKLIEEHNNTIAELTPLESYKSRVLQLERDILREQMKGRALYDEHNRPMNVHRWRVLESSDPKRLEKIRQVQALQAELIQKSDAVVEKDLLIQEREKVYVELKTIIARQPGPEVEEQILIYQQTFKDKSKQYAAMNDELDMYRMQVSMFKEDIARIEADLAVVKKRYFKTRKMYESKQASNAPN